jgi:hypothetical protein
MRWQELAKPFPPEEVQLKVQSMNKDRTKGMVVAYIDARMVMDRLDEVFGPDNWEDMYRVLSDKSADTEVGSLRTVEVECTLAVVLDKDVRIAKRDVGEGDSLKAAYSDAFKRAAVKFGVGRYLYSLPKVWADLNEYKQIKDPDAVKARLLGKPAQPQAEPAQPAAQPQAKPQAQAKPASANGGITEKQISAIRMLAAKYGGVSVNELDESVVNDLVSAALGRDATLESITAQEAGKVIQHIQEMINELR